MNTITISDQIIEDVAQRIATKLKVIDSDYISRKETLKELDVYCKASCKYTQETRELMCSSCRMGDAIGIIECIGELHEEEE